MVKNFTYLFSLFIKSSKIIFEFSENEFFGNKLLEKEYIMTKEMLVDSITSTKINWFEGKDVTTKEEEKKCKNKSKK